VERAAPARGAGRRRVHWRRHGSNLAGHGRTGATVAACLDVEGAAGTGRQRGGCRDAACAAGSEFSGLGGQLRPRRECAPFADPMAVVVREAGRASTRVAEPLALPQEAVPKWFVPGPEILQLARS